MRLTPAPGQYSQRDQQEMRRTIEEEDGRNYKKLQHIDMDPQTYIIMTSPDGTRYKVTMANGGTLTVGAL